LLSVHPLERKAPITFPMIMQLYKEESMGSAAETP
jgi:hypothetical protein